MKTKLRIQCEGIVREEVVELKGSSAGTLLNAGRAYLQPVNEGLPYDKRHHLLSVTPMESVAPLKVGAHGALG